MEETNTPLTKTPTYDKDMVISVGDGPEGIDIYFSHDRAFEDFSGVIPALYVDISLCGATVRLGPFMCAEVLRKFHEIKEVLERNNREGLPDRA